MNVSEMFISKGPQHSSLKPLAFVILGIIGAAALSTGHALAANLIWIFTNAGLAEINFRKGDKAQAFLFFVYLLLAVIGAATWALLKGNL